MKILAILVMSALSIFVLDSCGSRLNTSLSASPAPTGSPTAKWQDQKVDPVLCTGSTVSGITGRWTMSQNSGAIIRDFSLLIQDTVTTLAATCTLGNLSRSATVSVTSSFDSSHLNILTAETKSTGDRQLTCDASLTVGPKNYTIKGRCLSIQGMNGTHVFRYLGN